MIPLFDIADLKKFKATERLPLQCEQCGSTFYNVRKEVNKVLHNHLGVKLKYCSLKCKHASGDKTIITKCTHCGKIFQKQSHRLTKNNFCSSSCAGTYNNIHKTIGNRRSKLETYLEAELTKHYPSLNILFNDKRIITSELDIYIPELDIAFEINGIFHYKPIYGQEKLQQIQNNDINKIQQCINNNIELHIIDSSQEKQFKERHSNKFLSIIIEIINRKIGCKDGIDPSSLDSQSSTSP